MVRLLLVYLLFLHSVSCQQNDATCTCTDDVDPSLAFYEESVNGSTRTVRTNGVPSHEYHIGRDRANPHHVCLHPSEATLPVAPSLSGEYTVTPMGVIGILKTGGFVYNHKSSTDGVDDVANHPNNEQPGLDICHGHADASCTYHYHEISQLQECTHDGLWDSCKLIGWILDGYPLYSHCFYQTKNRYLQSCYSITNDADQDIGGDTGDYTYTATDACDLDEANGFDFSGKGILDSEGKEIDGYAYVASETYPYVMPFYAGSTWNRAQDLDSASTYAPTGSPTKAPVTLRPTVLTLASTHPPPSMSPSAFPSAVPSLDTSSPSLAPSTRPTTELSLIPSTYPTASPTSKVPPATTSPPTGSMTTRMPSKSPTKAPSKVPTKSPTSTAPITQPPTTVAFDATQAPASQPPTTKAPVASKAPTPSKNPSKSPTATSPTPNKSQKKKKKEKKIKLPGSGAQNRPAPQPFAFDKKTSPPTMAPSGPQTIFASAGALVAMLLTCGMGQ